MNLYSGPWEAFGERGGSEQTCTPPNPPQKKKKTRNLDQNINDSKISYLEFFF